MLLYAWSVLNIAIISLCSLHLLSDKAQLNDTWVHIQYGVYEKGLRQINVICMLEKVAEQVKEHTDILACFMTVAERPFYIRTQYIHWLAITVKPPS